MKYQDYEMICDIFYYAKCNQGLTAEENELYARLLKKRAELNGDRID